MAPEIWEGQAYTEKSDMWSLGVILYELCTFKKPFLADNVDDLKDKVLKDKIQLPEHHVPKDILGIITKLLRKNPIHRPSIKELLQYSLLRSKAKMLRIDI